MAMQQQIKVGLISCSGEELSVGLVSRLAALRVLEELKPKSTVTICLPLFLAGDDKERNFARKFPTITIDGCEKHCAFRATSKLSAPPVKHIVISDILKSYDVSAPRSRRSLDGESESMKNTIAELIASEVDNILAMSNSQNTSNENISIRELEDQ